MAKPLPEKLNPAWQAAVKRMLATPPQPLGAVKVGYQKRRMALTGTSVKATKKKPRAKAGLKLNEVERMNETD
jgi:hypothetical protein